MNGLVRVFGAAAHMVNTGKWRSPIR